MHLAIHRICAWPELISWFISAVLLNGLFAILLLMNASASAVYFETRVIVHILLACIPLTLLGWFVSAFFLWPTVRRICVAVNGGSLSLNESVQVLRGKHKNQILKIYELIHGQDGNPLLRLDLGADKKDKYFDLFEEYEIIRTERAEPAHSANSASLRGR